MFRWTSAARANVFPGQMLLPIFGAIAFSIIISCGATAQPAQLRATQAEFETPAVRAWTQRTHARIARTARRLASAPSGRPVVQFAVDRRGRLTGLRVIESSGNAHLDGAALAVVHMAAPFGALPSSYPRDIMSLVAPLRFENRTSDPGTTPGRRTGRRQL